MPTEDELRDTGFVPEDYETDPLDLWPENEPAIDLFSSISTQWRTGFSGPTGLDYNVLFSRMARMNLDDQTHERLFQDIRVIEGEALSIINRRDK